MEVYSASLLDHEYTAGPYGPGGPRGSAAMAPGVFLTSRRPSLSPQNSSSYSPSTPSPAGLASPGSAGAGQGNAVLLFVLKSKTLKNSVANQELKSYIAADGIISANILCYIKSK